MAGKPRRGLRPLIPVVAGVIGLALGVGNAGGDDAINTTVQQLQAPESLPQAPSVPDVPSTPSVPEAPSAPSVPDAPAPSVPDAPSAPSAPSVEAPSVPSAGGGSGSAGSGAGTGAGGGSASGGSEATDSAGAAGSGSAGSGSAQRAASPRLRAARAKQRAAARRDARERRARRERRLRELVTRLSGCLGLLPSSESRYLALRAGVGGERPLSRRAAAQRAGIPAERADTAERRGMRRLRRAARAGGCGAGSAGATVALTGSAGPQLQPAVLMAPAPPLRDTAELAGRDEGQGVKGVSESSGETGASTDKPRSALAPLADAVDNGTMAGWYVLMALVAALLLVLLAMRRGGPRGESAYADRVVYEEPWAVVKPPTEPEPPVEPSGTADGQNPPAQRGEMSVGAPDATPEAPEAPAPHAPHAPSRRRSAALAAGSIASLAFTALVRRRRR